MPIWFSGTAQLRRGLSFFPCPSVFYWLIKSAKNTKIRAVDLPYLPCKPYHCTVLYNHIAVSHPKQPRCWTPLANWVSVSQAHQHGVVLYHSMVWYGMVCTVLLMWCADLEKEVVVHDLFAVRCPLVHPLTVHPVETRMYVCVYGTQHVTKNQRQLH